MDPDGERNCRQGQRVSHAGTTPSCHTLRWSDHRLCKRAECTAIWPL